MAMTTPFIIISRFTPGPPTHGQSPVSGVLWELIKSLRNLPRVCQQPSPELQPWQKQNRDILVPVCPGEGGAQGTTPTLSLK